MSNFSARLRALRKQRDLKQAELAELMGVRPSAISNFEAGGRTPSLHNVKKLADVLEVTTDHLLGRDSDVVAYRGLDRLSPRHRELAEDFIQTLLANQKTRKEGSDR